MFDMTQPITMPVILGSIVIILLMVGAGLLVTEYYKRKVKKEEN